MNPHHIVTIPTASHPLALTNVLFIALFVPMRMKCRLTACGPLDTLQFMASTAMKFTKEMPRWANSPALPLKQVEAQRSSKSGLEYKNV